MSFEEQVHKKYLNYLKEFKLDNLPDNIVALVKHECKEAAIDAMNAGYSGSWDDGGAGRKVDAVKKFVKGFRCGRAWISHVDLLTYYKS